MGYKHYFQLPDYLLLLEAQDQYPYVEAPVWDALRDRGMTERARAFLAAANAYPPRSRGMEAA
jgi:hypothetical protein